MALLASPSAAPAQTDDLTQKVNPAQIMNVLKHIDGSGDESLRSAVFNRLGYECFYARKLDQWALQHRANIDGFVAGINDGHSRYWEKLEYDKAAGTLKVTSRKFPHCVCAYAQCPQPPKSLCTHCCRAFQTELFKTLLGQEVTVEITEAILLGGERCRTTIRVREKS